MSIDNENKNTSSTDQISAKEDTKITEATANNEVAEKASATIIRRAGAKDKAAKKSAELAKNGEASTKEKAPAKEEASPEASAQKGENEDLVSSEAKAESASDALDKKIADKSEKEISEMPKLTPPEEEMSFAEMLAEHEEQSESLGRLSPGQKVRVKIVAITSDTVFVSTGAKVDGIVEREDLLEDGELPYAVGDMVELYVISASAQEVRLSNMVRGEGSVAVLEEARNAELPVEGKVTSKIKGGYTVEVMKRRAFCPFSQIDIVPLADEDSVVGQTLPFQVMRVEQGGRNIVVSRRALLEKEQAEQIKELCKTLKEGDTLEAKITRLAPFGAFVELAPGVEGLVHLSELSWSQVGHADEVVSVGEVIRVKLLSMEETDKGMRFSLSRKAVTEDPWISVSERLKAGDTVSGRVVRLAPFGAFVEVLPGVDGLVHISEFSYEKRILKPEEMLSAGDTVSVRIKDISPEQKRMSLSIRDVAGDPWTTINDILKVGDNITGTVEKRAAFGLFITVAPGITGLLPTSVLERSPAKGDIGKLGSGDPIEIVIKQIDEGRRRISLAPLGEASDDGEAVDWKKHATKAVKPALGSLGEALQAAFKDKK